jgi:hypothetical protein
MPNTVVSTCVAPASSAENALAIAHPESLWPWNSMSAHRQVHPQQFGFLAPEGILGAESQLDARRLRTDPGQHLGRQRDDLVDTLAVAELPEV